MSDYVIPPPPFFYYFRISHFFFPTTNFVYYADYCVNGIINWIKLTPQFSENTKLIADVK